MSDCQSQPLSQVRRAFPRPVVAIAHLLSKDGMSRRASLRLCIGAMCGAAMTVMLAACGGGSGGSSTPTSADGGTPAPTPPGFGNIIISGRTNPAPSSLTTATARPDSVTPTIEEAAISTDDKSYETIFTGPVSKTFDETSTPPTLGEKDGLTAGPYKALRVTLSKIDWSANWGFANPSPCDGATTGSDKETVDLSKTPVFYFKTAELGGNTPVHYQANPLLPGSGYAGDAEHPFLLPAPIQILKDETTTVNLLFNTDRTLGCNRVSIFNRTDSGSVTPQPEIFGPDTKLYWAGSLAYNPLRDQIAVTNSFNSSVVFFDRDAVHNGVGPQHLPDVAPIRVLAGPGTILNNPAGIAFYCATANGSCDQSQASGNQYIITNSNNNSITTYDAAAADNTTPIRTIPERTITGFETGLNQPSGVALNLDQSGVEANDEILVANSGNNSITGYTRTDFGNSLALRTIQGDATGLSRPCGIAVDDQNNEIFVTNSGNDSITVYDLYTADVPPKITSGNIPYKRIISGAATGLSSPCGIYIYHDPSLANPQDEIVVANTGNDSITTFSRDANGNVAPIIPAITSVHKPVGVQLVGDELWVTQTGGQPTMALMPAITPVVTTTGSSNGKLSGDYNIVLYGVDMSRGVSGLGIKIPVMFSGRGTAHFDAQAAPWPRFSLKLNTDLKRMVMDAGCESPDFQTKNGFYGMSANQHFYAFTQDRSGVIDGSFESAGQNFTGTFANGNQIFVIYGGKSTGTNAPHLSSDGTGTGAATQYIYTSYYNTLTPVVRPIVDVSNPDALKIELDVGGLNADASSFLGITADSNVVYVTNPIGEMGSYPSTATPRFRGLATALQRAYSTHAGGLFENSAYGMAGLISGNSRMLAFMRDITKVDTDNCPLSFGMGLGLSQSPAKTHTAKDIKGTYFVSGFGDNFVSLNSRPQYFTSSGTITFDGVGGASMALIDNTEGELTNNNGTLTYKVAPRTIATITTDVIDIYSSASTTNPYASAIISQDGHTLIFYRNLAVDRAATNTRFLGFAILQGS